jgi:bacterioferritin (cytochrome b1)
MEATSLGHNRTGAATSPENIQQMMQAVDDLSPPKPISTLQIDRERQTYISQAEPVGSVPPPSLVKGALKKVEAKLKGVSPTLFMDKIGERIAFERTGTRLYDALITKYLAVSNVNPDVLPPVQTLGGTTVQATESDGPAETALETFRRIRSEELQHFHMLTECMQLLGGDPTAQTPCADVTAVASMGLMQAITDPRTTLAQSLNTILTAELTDNAGWELLIQLASDAGQDDLAAQFTQALTQEQEHLWIVKAWLQVLMAEEAGTPAV